MAGKDQRVHQETADTKLDLQYPEGWAFPKVGDILTVNYGKGLEKSNRKSGIVPVYGSNGVVGRHNSALTEGPTIILGRKGTVGAVNFSNVPCWPIDTTYFVDKFHGLLPQFIFHAMRSLNLGDLDTSTAIPGLNRNDIYKQQIPLPPIREQKRIVAKVEELLEWVNVVRERLDKVKEILKRFRQSVLAAACSGRLTADWRTTHLNEETAGQLLARIHQERLEQYEKLCLTAKKEGQKKPRKPSNLKPQIHHTEFELEIPDSWFWTTLEDIASTKQYAMSSGPFGSALGNKDYRDSGIPVIRGKNIQDGFFLLKNFVYVSEEKATQLARSYADQGDVVVVAVGSSGQAAIVPSNFPRSILSQNCNKITVDKSLAFPEFVVFFLQIEIAKNQLMEKTTDTARPFLSLTNLKKTLIAVPPLQEQKEIVRRVEAFFDLADSIEKRVAAATAQVEKLNQAILAKAFRGELVPQDPRDEPASLLLERIRATRTATVRRSRNSESKTKG